MSFSRAIQDERRRAVTRLLRAGLTEGEIAARLGVHRITIVKDVAALKAEWQRERRRDVDGWIAAELAKLQALEWGLWPAFQAGTLQAADKILAVMERRARLLGLDAPKRFSLDLSKAIRARAEELARQHDLPVEDVIAEAMAILDAASGE